MPEIRPSNDESLLAHAERCHGVRDGMLLGLVLITLIRTSEAMAADQAPILKGAPDPKVDNPRQWMPPSVALDLNPDFLHMPALAEGPAFSATEFRPHKHSLFDSDPAINSFIDKPMLQGTTVWQRMLDYRSRDGVRLLTLWQARGSSVSLQAGKRGDPSLQWTSHLTNRGESVQGLLDQLFSVSLAHTGNNSHNASRPAAATAVPTTQMPVPAATALK